MPVMRRKKYIFLAMYLYYQQHVMPYHSFSPPRLLCGLFCVKLKDTIQNL